MNNKDTFSYQWEEFRRSLTGCIYTAAAPLLIFILEALTRWINNLNQKDGA